MIKTTKTEILSTPSPDAPTSSISGNQLKNCENFTYLGSNLSFSGDLTNEIHRHINLASPAFGRLSKRVFGNKNLTIHTKIVVYFCSGHLHHLIWLRNMGPIPTSYQAT